MLASQSVDPKKKESIRCCITCKGVGAYYFEEAAIHVGQHFIRFVSKICLYCMMKRNYSADFGKKSPLMRILRLSAAIKPII